MRMLDGGELWMNNMSRMDDPREKKEWRVRVALGPGGIGRTMLLAADEANRMTDVCLRRGARIGCFTVDDKRTSASPDTLFHKGWARARMWDQYAAWHDGAVLAFDMDLVRRCDEAAAADSTPAGHPWKSKLFGSGTVQYLDEALELSLNMEDVDRAGLLDAIDDLQVGQGVPKKLYFTKNTDWASEREFRVVAVQWDEQGRPPDNVLKVRFAESLRAVIVGQGLAAFDLPSVKAQVARYPGVELLRCLWVNGAPQLAFIP